MSSEIIPVPPLPQVPERYDPQHMRNFQRQVTDFMHSASRPGVGLDGRITTLEAAAPYRRVALSSDVSIPHNLNTPIIFDTSVSTHGDAPAFDPGAGSMTLDTPGLWLVQASVGWGFPNGVSGDLTNWLLLGGTYFARGTQLPNNQEDQGRIVTTFASGVVLSAGTGIVTVKAQTRTTAASALTVHALPEATWCSAVRVGP